MVEAGEEVESAIDSERHFKESIINVERASTNNRTMDEALKAAAVTDKPNKEFVAAEVLSEKKCSS